MATRKILAVIIALALVLGMLVCLSGCSDTKSDTKEFELTESEVGGLVKISRRNCFIENFDYNYYQTILYDPDTLVMYSMITVGKTSNIAITALYNADGTLKLYSPDK